MNYPACFLPILRTLARQAGGVILSVYRSAFAVSTKYDNSPVTLADQISERLILDTLQALTPGIPIVAEEAIAARYVPDISSGVFWLVDPLDGTRAFIQHEVEFTVNIALIEAGKVAVGVVYAPALDHLYAAAGPGTAIVEKNGFERSLHVRPVPSNGAIVVASCTQEDSTLFAYFLKTHCIRTIVRMSSSLKLCLIAAGEADFYPRFSQTMEWDTAAGHIILDSAGGHLNTLNGMCLRYGKPGFNNPYFLACGG